MMHTIISLSDVFADAETPDILTEATKSGYSEYITVYGEKRLRRLFSTKPQDYLRF